MSTDDFATLATLHNADWHFYHRDCTGVSDTEVGEKEMTTCCRYCGMIVKSTRATVVATSA